MLRIERSYESKESQASRHALTDADNSQLSLEPGVRVESASHNCHSDSAPLSRQRSCEQSPTAQENKISDNPELDDSPNEFDTPESSSSGESMDNHGGNVTPPESPAQADSPGSGANVDHMGRLSLDQNDLEPQPSTIRRGRGILGAVPVVAPKRSASSELPRPAGRRSPLKDPSPPHSAGSRPPTSASLHVKPGRHPRHLRSRSGKSDHQSYRHIVSVSHLEVNSYSDQDKQIPPLDTIPSSSAQKVKGPGKQQDILAKATSKQMRYPGLVLQPDSSPISQEQLAAEVKGIYAGLVMVEAKCINIDAAQANDLTSHLGSEQWQALIALHRTLLYEHHDFLMATQHPSSTSALRGLAVKYSMPARMWKHGIHAFLEVLRHRRPESQDYMLAFIYLAYQMMALLYETVPAFLDTWIECLGDLARYRMAIEEEREAHTQWGGVAARWYTMASDRHPAVGRLNHHLGILERPSLRKLCLYTKALTCVIQFPNARDSLATLYGPIVQDENAIKTSSQSAEASIVTFHAMVFAGQDQASIDSMSINALRLLIYLATPKLRDIGASLAIVNVAALLHLGHSTNGLWQSYMKVYGRPTPAPQPSVDASDSSAKNTESSANLEAPAQSISKTDVRTLFYFRCFNGVVRSYDVRSALRDLLPFVHVMLVHFHSLHHLSSQIDNHTSGLLLDFDMIYWGGLSDYLNSLTGRKIQARLVDLAQRGVFPTPEGKNIRKPLAEDYTLRGLIWAQPYFPPDWFPTHAADDEGRAVETAEMVEARQERVTWLGLYIAHHTKYLSFDPQTQEFSAPDRGPTPPKVVRPAVPSTTRTSGPAPASPISTIRTATGRGQSSALANTHVKSKQQQQQQQHNSSRPSHQTPPAPKTYASIASEKPKKVRQDVTNVKVVNADGTVEMEL